MDERTIYDAALGGASALGEKEKLVSAPPKVPRQNGYDLLRIVAATMVIYGHAYSLTGRVSQGILGSSIQTVGLKIFFIISGLLVTRSWLTDPNVFRFAQRRAARIAPGLIVAILFGAFVIGPLFTQIGLVEYFTTWSTWRYLDNIALYSVYSLPGVFRTNVYPDAVNGSLWSLPCEVLMYILTPIVVRHDRLQKISLPLFSAGVAVLGIYFARVARPPVAPVLYAVNLLALLEVAVYFQIGALFTVFHLNRYAHFAPSLALLAIATWTVNGYTAGELTLILLLPPTVIGLGGLDIPLLQEITRGCDISYGLYLYAFPVQQALGAIFANKLTPIGNFSLALPLTAILAIASWYGIERPGLSLKPAPRPRSDR